MKRNLYIIMVCCAAALVSCKKNEVDNPNPGTDPEPQPEGKTVLYGSLSEATKTYLSPRSEGDNPEAWFDVYWEFQDSITIKKENGSYATFWTEAVTGSDKTVPFTKKSAKEFELETGEGIEAFYPAEIYGESLIWPAEQRYVVYSGDVSHTGAVGNNPMWAKAKIQKGTTEMLFYNLGGVIRFKLSPTEEFNVVMAMISADEPLSGPFTLEGTPDAPVVKMSNAVSSVICIKPNSLVNIAKDGTAAFYFAVPAGTYHGVQITLVGEDGKKVNARLAAGKALEVKRAEVVRLTANGVTPSMEGSNCFIGEGSVPIVITAMGNAFDGTTALDGNDAKAVWKAIGTNAQGCKIVWETKNTTEQVVPGSKTIIESATFADGVLTVIPTGTPGNALVAITDGANGTGNIVWSYHIWVPETPLNIVRINNANGKVVFIDRNIGALRAADPDQTDNTKSIGMFYQWGRKDPMLAYCDFSGSNLMNGISFTDKEFSGNNNKMKGSIENPSSFIKGGNTFIFYDCLKLWGYTERSSQSNTYIGPVCNKTIYDPCPMGYRVAGDDDFRKLTGAGNYLKPSLAKNNAFSFLDNKFCFPMIGCVNSDTGRTYKNSYYGVWTATSRLQTSATAWMFQYNTNNTYASIGQYSGGGSDGWYGSAAFNVRCVRDDTQSPASEGYTLNEMDHEYINFFE